MGSFFGAPSPRDVERQMQQRIGQHQASRPQQNPFEAMLAQLGQMRQMMAPFHQMGPPQGMRGGGMQMGGILPLLQMMQGQQPQAPVTMPGIPRPQNPGGLLLPPVSGGHPRPRNPGGLLAIPQVSGGDPRPRNPGGLLRY